MTLRSETSVALVGLLLGAAGLAAQTSPPAEQAVQWMPAPEDEPWGVFPCGY